MWRVLIADDEPKIRRGLRNNVEWQSLDMEVIAEAEDGLEALELSEQLKPDVLLVDICMPILNGLEFVEKMLAFLTDSVIIVITGHNEFVYAQKALKLGVFDYLLKPASKDQLYAVLGAAKERLQQRKYMHWTAEQVSKHMPQMKERFLNDWIGGSLTEVEVKEQLGFLQCTFDSAFCLVLIKVIDRIQLHDKPQEWDRLLLLFAVQNVVEDVLRKWGSYIVFRDRKEYIVALVTLNNKHTGSEIVTAVISTVEQVLKKTVLAFCREGDSIVTEAPIAYERLYQEAAGESSATPIVLLAKKYIRDNYHKEDLNLKEVADMIKISPSYLSRLLRQETGSSFIDYLTQVRIKQAIILLQDPMIKILEISKRVGYNGQHYFSMAFKKVLGVSPAEYRKGGVK
ncbi:response regulator transcription factor [Paenibacillus sedimenti]|uniref:Response regulator n=1 Tax=Paenibacillus sedimenti TaxID=2770274 RepID=A0A926KJH3_9BACL|nr:response regulator [Paenibacillus sedimenti]MBD0378874.1 response regulator [Paenibacillus sedimenti]